MKVVWKLLGNLSLEGEGGVDALGEPGNANETGKLWRGRESNSRIRNRNRRSRARLSGVWGHSIALFGDGGSSIEAEEEKGDGGI